MGTRVPVQHYNLRAANSFITGSLHDLNTVDGRPGEIDGISDVDRDAVTEDSLDDEDESNSVNCLGESYRNSIPLHSVGVDEGRSPLENSGRTSSPNYSILNIDDVLPIENARVRFLQIFVDHFIEQHVVEAPDSSAPDYGHGADKINKRKQGEVQYEGDPRFVLPLMYVANLYENLVSDVNLRLSSLDGIREKTIGVALEAAGGLYRKLAKKFPRKGPCSFKRRELATSLETRTRFPELVVQEEKRVRFVVVNGLAIVEKPSAITIEDMEWFKRLTGRHEVAISARDYKFYSPRHKYRRVTPQSASNIPGMAVIPGSDGSPPLASATGFRPLNEPQTQQQPSSKHHMQQLPHQPQFQSLHQGHHQSLQHSQQTAHFSHIHQCTHTSHLADIPHQQQSPPPLPRHLPCLQSLPGGHIGGRLHLIPTSPAKFCDECGVPYLRETSKFCSECGTKRLGT
ncbi:uncharacterized protein At2g02148 [Dioscorea cayenensis subsp. rotundata]|uniref:Uncharacterized protein At2g02148 n=1 Tax=Dioscorea cayennensis subsp. rotundata TaxID=55577 RepID=A0AB40AYJ1_DIOCR|nr:uncharacterized protein At2g02148 [Dioscorea cayenensis subsp. rotundata]